MLREKIIDMRRVVVEMLTEVQRLNVDIAQYRACGKICTSKDEKVVIEVKTAMNFELQYQADRCSTDSQTVENTNESLSRQSNIDQ